MTSFIRKNFLALFIFFIATISLILIHVLPGIYGGIGEEKYYIETLDFVFGGAEMQVSTKDFAIAINLGGGVSIFGVLSIISLITGVGLAIASIRYRTMRLDYYGIFLILLSGVFMLLLFNMGTLVTINNNLIDFRSFVLLYGLNLSTGAIVYGIILAVGGIVGIIIEENNLIR